jgi:predicted transcriptional regulator
MRPAHKRRIVLYDLNEPDRERLKEVAEKDNRTVSRWASDAVRSELRRRGYTPKNNGIRNEEG